MTQVLSQRAGYRPCGPATVHRDNSEVPLKTQGEIEAAICDVINRFQQEYMGRGPKDIRVHLIGDLLVVRLRGVLSAPNSSWSSRSRPRRDGTWSNRYARI